jgi:V8-like Glu-specific endopeptidase
MAPFISYVIGAKDTRELIFGGTEVKPNRFLYLASLHQRNASTGELSFMCGGTLIAPSVMLTAAHCNDYVDVVFLRSFHEVATASSRRTLPSTCNKSTTKLVAKSLPGQMRPLERSPTELNIILYGQRFLRSESYS